MSEVKKQSNIRHYMIVIMGCMLMFTCTGITFSCAGIFIPEVIKPLAEGGLEIGKGEFALWMTIAMIVAFFFMPLAGKLIGSKDVRVVLSAAVILMGGSVLSFSFFTSVFMFYGAAILIGIAMAFTSYLAIPVMLNHWFKERVGFFMGLCTAFSGIGGVVFNPVLTAIITTYGWRTGYMVGGILILVLCLPFTLFAARSNPSDLGLLPYGAKPKAETTGDQKAAPPQESGVSASVARRSPAFIALLVFTGLVGFGVGIYTYMPSYAVASPLGIELGAAGATAMAAALASAAMAGQAIGKIMLGFINDKSVRAGLFLAMICGSIGLLVFWVLPIAVALILVGGFLFGIFYASALVQVPMMTRTMFGGRDYAKIYSNVSMVSVLLSAFAVSVWGFIIEGMGNNYDVLWIGGIAIVVIGAILGIYALKAGSKLEKTTE